MRGAGLPEPTPGSYLQVAARQAHAADGVVESLKNKGFRRAARARAQRGDRARAGRAARFRRPSAK